VVRLVVTFVEAAGDVKSVSDVTGFASSDVVATAISPLEGGAGQILPVVVGVRALGSVAHELTVQPDMSQWPASMHTGCSEVTLTLAIPGAFFQCLGPAEKVSSFRVFLNSGTC
jgi:hypothetical protein